MVTKGELSRQRIVAAADQLFYQQGYANTSFSDIANSVDISRGNFYYHFKTKDEILSAVIDKRLLDIQDMLNDWELANNDPKKNILCYIEMLISNQGNIKNHGCPVGVMCNELIKTDHLMQSEAIKMQTLFLDWLIHQFKQLGYSKKIAQQHAMHLLSREQGIASITHSFEDTTFLTREIELLRQWLDGIVD